MRPPALWNPIIAKEYRSRMRTWRSPVAITTYLMLLGGLGWALFAAISANAANGSIGQQAAGYGRTLFTFLIIFQLLLLTFITPALTAGGISGERERQTIDLLFVTRIRPVAILWGKLVASMSFVFMLLLLSVPIFSLVFLFGGIELDQLLTSFLVTIVAALTLGALGLLFSTVAPRTLPSTVAAYGAAFLLLFGTILIGVLLPTVYDPLTIKTAPAAPVISYASPITALVAIVSDNPSFAVAYGNPLPLPMIRAKASLATGQSRNCFPVPNGGVQCTAVASGIGVLNQQSMASGPSSAIPSGPFAGWQYWQATVALDGGIALLALLLSALLLPPTRRWSWPRLRRPAAAQ